MLAMFSFLRPAAPSNRLSVPDIAARVERGEMLLLDVREPAEVRSTGRAAGALHVPLALLPMKADPRHPDHDPRLDPKLPVAVYCASGGRSGVAAQALGRLGYADVTNLGGLRDWVSGGGALSR
jgi:rhodanese-related sulfurtransferase